MLDRAGLSGDTLKGIQQLLHTHRACPSFCFFITSVSSCLLATDPLTLGASCVRMLYNQDAPFTGKIYK